MAKSLDGIKKLNPEDIKKYRKIVLNYIGEKDPAEVSERKNPAQTTFFARKVDGLKLNRISSFKPKEGVATDRPPAASLPGDGQKRASVLAEISPETNAGSKDPGKQPKEEGRQVQKAPAEKMATEKIEQEKTGPSDRKTEIIMGAEERFKLKVAQSEGEKRVKERSRREKMKREKEAETVKREREIAMGAAREKKINKRRKAWAKFKKNLRFKFKELYYTVRHNTVQAIVISAISLVVAYAVFCLAVLRFRIDNNLTNQALGYIPVPAVITSQGVVGYNEFVKMESQDYSKLSLGEKKKYLVEQVILSNLKKKYRLPANAAVADLAVKYVLDEDFNQISFSRINKVNELLKAQAGIEQLAKYADEYNSGVYYDASSAVEKFGPVAMDLAIGQTSNIVPRADGYYIIEKIDDKDGLVGLKYLFIGARTLDQYLNKELGRVQVIILAN